MPPLRWQLLPLFLSRHPLDTFPLLFTECARLLRVTCLKGLAALMCICCVARTHMHRSKERRPCTASTRRHHTSRRVTRIICRRHTENFCSTHQLERTNEAYWVRLATCCCGVLRCSVVWCCNTLAPGCGVSAISGLSLLRVQCEIQRSPRAGTFYHPWQIHGGAS